MWEQDIDKMQRQDESERLEQAEKYILYLKDTIAELKERIGKLEEGSEGKQTTTHHYWTSPSGRGVLVRANRL